MKEIVFFLLLITVNPIYSQDIKGKVVNQSDLRGISFASISYKNAEVGVYADELGGFSISRLVGDTLIVSALGFEQYLLPINSQTNLLTIELLPIAIQVEEVIIQRGKRAKTRKITGRLGSLSTKINIYTSGIKGRTTVVKVEAGEWTGAQIETLHLALVWPRHLGKMPDAQVRPQLYTVHPTTGKPHKSVPLGSMPITVQAKNLILNVPLEHLGLIMPSDGIFIGVEWMGEIEPTKRMNISPWYSYSKNPHLSIVYTKFMDKEWLRSSVIKSNKNSVKKGKEKEEYLIPSFSVTVVK